MVLAQLRLSPVLLTLRLSVSCSVYASRTARTAIGLLLSNVYGKDLGYPRSCSTLSFAAVARVITKRFSADGITLLASFEIGQRWERTTKRKTDALGRHS